MDSTDVNLLVTPTTKDELVVWNREKIVASLEKEAELAFGVSKSNSGIIHPGTQMSPQSLKGQLCVLGNYILYMWLI